MQTPGLGSLSADSVSYDEPPIAELELGGVEYRIDPGRGSAVAISRREPGTWDWAPLMEGRWDGSRLRAKGLDSEIVTALGAALGTAMRGERGPA